MNVVKDALWAVLIGAWIAGLVHQIESWPMTAAYVVISLAMAAAMFGGRLARRPDETAASKA